jgi:hypothetical protein
VEGLGELFECPMIRRHRHPLVFLTAQMPFTDKVL